MKKIILVLILCASLLVNTGCSVLLISMLTRVSKKVTDPQEYGEFHNSVEIPEYYPEAISAYTVNDYCYVIEKNSSLCYEVFIDVSLSKGDFEALITSAMDDSRTKTVKGAQHSPEFKEIVFFDEYEFTAENEFDLLVSAHIEKVIYNEKESRIIYSLLYVEEYSYYKTQNVEFFQKLKISPEKYSVKDNNSI